MELAALVDRQINADRERGFQIDFADDTNRLYQIERDLIGLFGEVGEFANLLKKVRLATNHRHYPGPTLAVAEKELRDELADVAIYLFRLSVMLGGNLEADIIAKMDVNDIRYKSID